MLKIHESNSLELATYLSSRICHDLISPVGAIVNGLELLNELEDDSEKQSTLELVQQSAQQASARLQLCRFAFGAIGSFDTEIGCFEVKRVLDEYMEWEKTDLVWNELPESLPKNKAKLLINIVLLAKRCLPRGGMIRTGVLFQKDSTYSFSVGSTGEKAFVPEEITQVIVNEIEEMQNTDTALPLYCRYLARTCGMEVNVESDEGAVRFSAKQGIGG